MKQAFISAEDKNFYTHNGIDPEGVGRAVMVIAQGGRHVQGASTITQQVAKNFLVGNERSIERKIREALISFRIEAAYSKERILELYLNEIYLGLGNYGVAAAALNYFNKSVNELTHRRGGLSRRACRRGRTTITRSCTAIAPSSGEIT